MTLERIMQGMTEGQVDGVMGVACAVMLVVGVWWVGTAVRTKGR